MTTANGRNEFSGRVALVTGAAGVGIGQTIARRLADRGARVVVSDIHERRTKEVTEAMAADYPHTNIYGCTLDVGDRGQIDDVIEQVIDRFGAIDVLVTTLRTTSCDRSSISTRPTGIA